MDVETDEKASTRTSPSPCAEDDDQVEDERVVSLLEQIHRLHEATEDLEKEELRLGHHERAQHHHESLQRGRTSRGGTQTPNLRNPGNCSLNRVSFLFGVSIIFIICVGTPLVNRLFEHVLGVRCFVPNNYLVWEATRPKSDCTFCRGLDGPIILPNLTRDEFAVSTEPIYSLLCLLSPPQGLFPPESELISLFSSQSQSLLLFLRLL